MTCTSSNEAEREPGGKVRAERAEKGVPGLWGSGEADHKTSETNVHFPNLNPSCPSQTLVRAEPLDLAGPMLHAVLIMKSLFRFMVAFFKTKRSLALENLALRHQLQVLQRSGRKPRLSK